MTFGKTVLAYLTGWLIVQPLYNRVYAAWRRRELAKPSAELRALWAGQAVAIVDEIERRAREKARRSVLHDEQRLRAGAAGWQKPAAPPAPGSRPGGLPPRKGL